MNITGTGSQFYRPQSQPVSFRGLERKQSFGPKAYALLRGEDAQIERDYKKERARRQEELRATTPTPKTTGK